MRCYICDHIIQSEQVVFNKVLNKFDPICNYCLDATQECLDALKPIEREDEPTPSLPLW